MRYKQLAGPGGSDCTVVTFQYSRAASLLNNPVMMRGLSQLFAAGLAVAAAIGEDSDREEPDGSHLHTRNGVAADEVAGEADAFACAAYSHIRHRHDELCAAA